MNGGQAYRIEQSEGEAGPPPIPDFACQSDAPESAARRRRSSVDTVPASDPWSEINAGRPDWCVDVGDSLLTMTMFELWAAIERAEVAPWMRVWREGMECWTPVQELPELQWAVSSAPRWEPKLVAAETIKPPAPRTAVMLPPPVEPLAWPVSEVATRGTPSEDLFEGTPAASRTSSLLEVTPAPFMTEAPPIPRAPASGVRWVAGGSMVAVAALSFALVRMISSPISMPANVHAAAPTMPAAPRPYFEPTPPFASPPLASPPLVAPTPATTASATAEPAITEPSARPARREERGQRRLPRGGKRAYGR